MLQRSVTLIRRLLCGLPYESTSRSGSEVMCTAKLCPHGLLPPLQYNQPFGFCLAPERLPSSWVESGVDPLLGAIRPVLFLPDRDDLFQGIDQPATGVERVLAMGA